MRLKSLALTFAILAATTSLSRAETLTPEQQAFRDIYAELISIDTTDKTGDTKKAVDAMAAHLKKAGIADADIEIFSPAPNKGNLVARLRGNGSSGLKPILFLAHIDVVDAPRNTWKTNPFELTEVNGQFVGRGVIDDKAMAASLVANLIQLKKEGFQPNRDIVIALTTDEEGGEHNGAAWLTKNKPELIDAEFVINEGGEGTLKDGKPFTNTLQRAEKTYQTYTLEISDSGGHSSQPRKDNPITRMAEGLVKLSKLSFPIKLNDVTRGFFEEMAKIEEPATSQAMKALLAGKTDDISLQPLLDSPHYNSQIHTTCVATMLQAGQVENALPQSVKATVNCRVMPGDPVADVKKAVIAALNDSKIDVKENRVAMVAPPSPIKPEVLATLKKISNEMWPNVPLIPVMSAGGTDSKPFRLLGIPAYGISGMFLTEDDGNMHGIDEHGGVKQVYDCKEFLYRVAKEFSSSEKGKS